MPGKKQVGNSCAAYTLMMTVSETGLDTWDHATAQGYWGRMQFEPAEDATFATKKYTNPCKMSLVAQSLGLQAKLAMSGLTRIYAQMNNQVANTGPAQRSLAALGPLAEKIDLLCGAYSQKVDPQEPLSVVLGTNWYASIACMMPSEGAGAMHNVLVKGIGGQLQVYDSNCDDLSWNPLAAQTRAGDPVDTGLGYPLYYSGFAVLMRRN